MLFLYYLFFSPRRRPPGATLFPYTTLFRSCGGRPAARSPPLHGTGRRRPRRTWRCRRTARSEEHTSELQSRGHLVCRLLLEKKKGKATTRKKQRVRNRTGKTAVDHTKHGQR